MYAYKFVVRNILISNKKEYENKENNILQMNEKQGI